MEEVYLDNSATTRVYKETAEKIVKVMTEDYGNPSSMHHKGLVAENLVKESAEKIAATLKCKPSEILFTSGGTESDNMALTGIARAWERKGKHLITTCIEHPAVLSTMKQLEKEGFEVTYLPVDENGLVNPEDVQKAIRPDTILVSVMFVNNEIGACEPIAEIGEVIRKTNPDTFFHVDAVQGYGKYRIIPKRMKIDLLSVSSHKIHGPKGCGFLYIREGVRILPIIHGGGQQKNLRSGTDNVPGIVGLADAAERTYKNLDADREKLYGLKKYFIEELTSSLKDIKINGLTGEDSAPHIISVSIRGVRAEVLLHALEDKHVYVSAGSACASNNPHVSETLKAIGTDKDLLDSTIRVSMSVFTEKEDLDAAVKALNETVPILRKYSRQ